MSKPEHGIEAAAYLFTVVGYHQPTLFCLCNKAFSDDTWEDAGVEFDEHLEEFAEEDES